MAISIAPAVDGLTKFLKAHERLIICLAVIAGLWVAYSKYANILELRANEKYQTDKQALVVQQQTTAALQKKLSTDEAQWTALTQKLLAQNTQLANAVVRRDQATKKQQTVDQNLDVTAAASRLSAQTKAQPGEVTSVGNTVVLDLPITRSVVEDLDALVTAQADLVDAKTQLSNEQQLTQTAQANADAQQKISASLTTELTDETKTCKAQVADVKAKARKSKLHWFLRGLGIGAGLVAYILK